MAGGWAGTPAASQGPREGGEGRPGGAWRALWGCPVPGPFFTRRPAWPAGPGQDQPGSAWDLRVGGRVRLRLRQPPHRRPPR